MHQHPLPWVRSGQGTGETPRGGAGLGLRQAGLAVVGLLVGAVSAQAEPTTSAHLAGWADVEREFQRQAQSCGAIGASLAFIEGDAIRAQSHYGFADRATRRPVDADTIFHWASCTKPLTAVAIMQLRDRGRLELDQPLRDHCPELRAVHDPHGAFPRATIRHALQHAVGLRAPTWPWRNDEWQPHEPTQWSQLVAMMPYTDFQFVPGSKFAYSNLGIVLLGRAIELCSGDDYEVYMDKNVLRPLGMRNSYFDTTPYHLQRHRSHGYVPNKDGTLRDIGADFDTGVTVSNGGLNAPVGDMARFVSLLLGACARGSDAEAVLARASLQEMGQPTLPTGSAGEHMGLCLFVQDHGGERVLTHTGGQQGYVSFFYAHPASRTGAVGVFNTGTAGPAMQAIRKLCIERLSLRRGPPAPPPVVGDAPVKWRQFTLRLARSADAPLRIVLTAPTAGHTLTLEREQVRQGTAEVYLRLETPGEREAVAQVVTDSEVELVSAAMIGAARRVRVHVATWQRGVEYLVAPQHEEAAVLPLR